MSNTRVRSKPSAQIFEAYRIPLGGQDLLDNLRADAKLTANASAKQGLDEMALLFTLLKAYGVFDKV